MLRFVSYVKSLSLNKSKSLRLLHPLDVHNLQFELISKNFIVGLGKTQNKFDNIIDVVDRLTKIAYFILTVTIIIVYEVTESFMREIFKHYRILRKIINNRDRKFVSKF